MLDESQIDDHVVVEKNDCMIRHADSRVFCFSVPAKHDMNIILKLQLVKQNILKGTHCSVMKTN